MICHPGFKQISIRPIVIYKLHFLVPVDHHLSCNTFVYEKQKHWWGCDSVCVSFLFAETVCQ